MRYIIETMPTNFSPRRGDSPLRPIAHIHSDLEIIFNLKGSTIASTDVAFSSGFSSIRSFNRVFQNLKGMSPREYRRQ